jgi:MoaA/NifB/PqqE/SkfB family radical SAM enzyme
MGIYNNIKESVEKKVLRELIKSLSDTSDKGLLRIGTVIEKLSSSDSTVRAVVLAGKNAVRNNHPMVTFIRKIAKEMNPKCRDKFVENLIVQGLILNQKKRKKCEAEGFFSPLSVLISPTMRCNLNCIGCYAGNYSKKDDLGFEMFDKIVTEGEELGTGVFTILGGEPLVVKDELFKICEKHNKSYFQFFTNSCLIDEKVADKLAELGNMLPIISIEGYEKETDGRRGKGVYQKIMKAMDLLRSKGVPFGYSVAVTNKNTELVSSDEFVDFMIKKGAYIGWHFLYMPVGKNPDLSLMPTPKQRKHLKDRWEHIRATRPIFIVDFWNDAPFVGGCIAGKHYIHVTSKGDVEPCIFTHFAVDNVKNKSLAEVMKSGYFAELRRRQPYHDNLYMPCMWIDHPEVGAEVHAKFGCYPTHEGADEILKDKKIREGLKKYSKEVHEIFDPVWEKEKKEKEAKKKEKEKKK